MQKRLDRTVLTVSSLDDFPDDVEFWRKKEPHERIAALEFMRQINYGYDPLTSRFQRFFEVTELS